MDESSWTAFGLDLLETIKSSGELIVAMLALLFSLRNEAENRKQKVAEARPSVSFEYKFDFVNRQFSIDAVNNGPGVAYVEAMSVEWNEKQVVLTTDVWSQLGHRFKTRFRRGRGLVFHKGDVLLPHTPRQLAHYELLSDLSPEERDAFLEEVGLLLVRICFKSAMNDVYVSETRGPGYFGPLKVNELTKK